MSKKVVFLFLIFIFIFPLNIFAVELEINSKNAILYNLNDDDVLFEKNSDEKVSIASLTKIMTAIVALEHIENLDDKVILTYKDFEGLAEANAAVCGFRVGEEVTYRDLLYGLLLPSGADAAQALCRNIAGSNENFVNLMNEKATELKLSNTHFVNSTGLDIDNHYSTVKDVSTMFKYAINNKNFLEIIKTKSYTTSNGRLTFRSTISRALDTYNLSMDYLVGGKTGTTGDAGLCLATISNYNNVDYMLITVGAPYSKTNPYNYLDAKMIYEYFMNNYSYKNIVDKNDLLVKIKTKYSKNDYVYVYSSKSIDKYLDNEFDKNKLSYKYKGVDTITLDMEKNYKLGSVDIIYNDELLDTVDIFLPERQQLDFLKYLSDKKLLIFIPLVIIISFIILVFRRKKRLNRV